MLRYTLYIILKNLKKSFMSHLIIWIKLAYMHLGNLMSSKFRLRWMFGCRVAVELLHPKNIHLQIGECQKMCVPFRCIENECVFDVVVTDRPRKHRQMTWRGGGGQAWGWEHKQLGCVYMLLLYCYIILIMIKLSLCGIVTMKCDVVPVCVLKRYVDKQ